MVIMTLVVMNMMMMIKMIAMHMMMMKIVMHRKVSAILSFHARIIISVYCGKRLVVNNSTSITKQ